MSMKSLFTWTHMYHIS